MNGVLIKGVRGHSGADSKDAVWRSRQLVQWKKLEQTGTGSPSNTQREPTLLTPDLSLPVPRTNRGKKNTSIFKLSSCTLYGSSCKLIQPRML